MKLKDKILDTSIELFNRNGAHSITTNHIIDAMGISPGTLYYHYKNKEEIIQKIFEMIIEDFGKLFISPPEKLQPADIIDFSKEIYTLLYKYRFFYIELPTLLDRDPRLKKKYIENRELRRLAQKALYDLMVKSDIVAPIYPEHEVSSMLDNLWIISDFFFAYQMSQKDKITRKDIQEGVLHYYYMIRPYLTENAAQQCDRLILK